MAFPTLTFLFVYALQDNHDAEAFLKPVSKTDYPDYYDSECLAFSSFRFRVLCGVMVWCGEVLLRSGLGASSAIFRYVSSWSISSHKRVRSVRSLSRLIRPRRPCSPPGSIVPYPSDNLSPRTSPRRASTIVGRHLSSNNSASLSFSRSFTPEGTRRTLDTQSCGVVTSVGQCIPIRILATSPSVVARCAYTPRLEVRLTSKC